MKLLLSWIGRASACFILAGCAGSAPPAKTFPSPLIPDGWSGAPGDGHAAGPSDTAWWALFDDPTLASLMARAAATNLDVALADARLREARALTGLTAAAGRPRVNFTSSYASERDSQNAPGPVLVHRSGEVESLSGTSENLFQTGFDAGWEIDLFGARARATDAARADAQAFAYDRNAVLRTVCAEVARNYILLREFQQRLLVARADLDSQQDMLKLMRARRVGGFVTDSEVAHASAQATQLSAQIPALELETKKAAHRLGILLGQPPGALLGELRDAGAIPHARSAVAARLPSELLRRRPDIQRSERQLAAAMARREVAIADLFPKISLMGTVGLASVSASNLFSSASLFTKIGPTMTWPIFRREQIATTIEVRGIQEEQAFVAYRQTMLNAFEEVENALAALATEKARVAALTDVIRDNELALVLARSRYSGGMTDFRAVLDAQHSLAQARSELLASDGALAIAMVALFKSAGGGWDPATAMQPVVPAHPAKD